MRAKTSDFLKVLNRARPDAPKNAEKKTITYVSVMLYIHNYKLVGAGKINGLITE